MTKTDLAWLVGFLEGEGSFFAYTHNCKQKGKLYKYRLVGMHVGSVDLDILKRVARLLDTKVYGPYPNKGFNDNSTIYQCNLQARELVVKWMKLLYPLMGKRRQRQIRMALKQVGEQCSRR